MAKDKVPASATKISSKGIKRKQTGEKGSPRKKTNVGKKQERKDIPHTVSKAPISPLVVRSDSSKTGTITKIANTPVYKGMLPRPFPSLSNSEPPPVKRMVSPDVAIQREVMKTSKMATVSRRGLYRPETSPVSPFLTERSVPIHCGYHGRTLDNPLVGGNSMLDNLNSSHMQNMQNMHDEMHDDFENAVPVDRDAESHASGSPPAKAIHDEVKLLNSMFKDESEGSPVPEYWQGICTKAFNNRIKSDKFAELQEQYKPPENIKSFAKGPRLNSMVYRELPEYVRGKDKSLLETQHKFAAITTPLMRAIEMVDSGEPELDRRQLLGHLSHCLTFLGSAQFHVSMQRRECIRPHVAEKYRSLFNKDVPVTDYLLGNDAEKTIKEMKTVTDLRLRKPQFRDKEANKSGFKSSGNNNRASYFNQERRTYKFNKAASKGNNSYNANWSHNSFNKNAPRNASYRGASRPPWFKKQ